MRIIEMASTHAQETIAPLATKSGATISVLSGGIAFLNQNVGFFSSAAFIVGMIIGIIGLVYQSKSAKAAKELSDAENKRNQEIHDLRIKALKKQVSDI